MLILAVSGNVDGRGSASRDFRKCVDAAAWWKVTQGGAGLDPHRGPVRACYEAGPTGFGLYRAAVEVGIAIAGIEQQIYAMNARLRQLAATRQLTD